MGNGVLRWPRRRGAAHQVGAPRGAGDVDGRAAVKEADAEDAAVPGAAGVLLQGVTPPEGVAQVGQSLFSGNQPART